MKSKTAVIFIHGFMGCSRQFDEIIESLEGCDARLLRHILPGHEKDTADFIKSNCGQWQQSANDYIDSLRLDYDRLVLVGHSMGGLIAVRAAISNPEKISGIIAIGLPIKVTVRSAWIKNNMLASKPQRENEDKRVTAARQMAGVKMTGTGDYIRAFPRSAQFLRVARLTRRELSKLAVPLTVINFKNDEIVAFGAKRFVEKALPAAKILMLDGSYHFLFTKDEVEIMAEEIKNAVQG